MKYLFSFLLFLLGFANPLLALPPINIDVAAINAKEGTPAVDGVFTFTLDAPAPVGGLVLSYVLTGTATNPANYTLTSTDVNVSALSATGLTIAAGAMSATFKVVAINDFLVNTSRTVILTLTANPPDYQINMVGTATVTITDDDNLFSVNSAGTPTENGATGTFTFTRPTSTAGAITVNFTVAGTATLTTHYTVSSAATFTYTATTGTIIIPSGSNSATLTITPINDMLVNAARTVILTVVPSGVPNYTISTTNNSATLNIADFVAPTVNVTISTGTNPKEGTPSINGVFNITLAAAPLTDLVINYTLAGTAINTTNYNLSAGTNVIAFTATTFTVAAGATNATINIIPINNFIANVPSLTIIMGITANLPIYNFTGTGNSTATLTDDDNKFRITASGTPSEDTGTGTFTITRTNTVGAVIVNFTVGGTAVYPTNYTVSSTNPLTFNAGSGTIALTSTQASATITITPINDQIINSTRTVILTLADGTPPEYTVGVPPDNSATLNITDGAVPVISLSTVATPIESGSNAGFVFTRTGATTLSLVVEFDLTGVATANTNYTVSGATLVLGTKWTTTINAGSTNRTVVIIPINDFTTNSPRTVIATTTLTSPAKYAIAASPNDTKTLNILDDANPISVASSGSVTGGNTGTYTFSRVTATGSAIAISFNAALVSGTPTYTASSSNLFAFNPTGGGFIVIPAGQTSAVLTINAGAGTTTGRISITLVPNTTPNYTISTTPPENLDILSVGSYVVNVNASSPITEGGTASIINFVRTGSFSIDVLVTFSVSNNGVNYTMGGAGLASFNTATGVGTAIVPANGASSSVSITLTANDDFIANGTRIVKVSIVSATFTGFGFPIGATNFADIVVNDSNKQIGIVGGTNANESGIGTTFTITRVGGNTLSQNINFSLSGTATRNTDYTLSGGGIITATGTTITIPAFQNSVSVLVTPINDLLANSARTVSLTLTSFTGIPAITVLSSPNNTATITIDDDPNIITISVSPTPIASEQGNMQGKFIVKRNAISVATPINFTVSGTATFGTKYTASAVAAANLLYNAGSGTVTIPTGETQVEIIITPINDFMVNAPRTVILQLVDSPTMPIPRPYRVDLIGTPANTTATISIADDSNTVSITKIGADPTKSGAVVGTFQVTRTNTVGDLDVNIIVAGSATLNTNYTQSGADFAGGTVKILDGQASKNITISAINDFAITPIKDVILSVDAGQYIASATNNTSSMNIIDDNNIVELATSGNAFESGADGLPQATTFTFSRTTLNNTTALPVKFSIGGAAVPITNYTLSAIGGITFNATNTQGTVTIPANANSVVVTLTPINDYDENGNKNVVFAIVATSPQTYTIINTAANIASTNIIDDNNKISIVASGTPSETGATGTFTFSRTVAKSTPLVVNFTVGGTAIFTTNPATTKYTVTGATTYATNTGTVTIPANQTDITITITPINDFVANAARSVILTLIDTSPNKTYIISQPPNHQAALSISDDNNLIKITQTGIAQENGTTANFTISRQTATASNVTVNFNVAGSAILGINYTQTGAATYTATSGTATILAGQTSVDIVITPIDDNTINADRNVILNLQNPMPFMYQLSTNPADITATMLIKNDDPQATVVLGNNAQETNLVVGKFIINFNAALAANTTINYAISGTANASRYVISGGLNTVAASTTNSQTVVNAASTTAEIIITPIDDFEIDPNETIILTLLPSANAMNPDYFITTNIVATMQIVDNDIVVACMSPSNNTITANKIAKIVYKAATINKALQFNFNITLTGTDVIKVYNGNNATAVNLIAIYNSTNTIPTTFTSINDFVTLEMTIAAASASSGTYTATCIDATPKVDCGSPNATAYTIGSLFFPYPANADIVKTYQSSSFAGTNGQISATFTRFDVESSYDYVEVFDGLDINAPSLGVFHNNQLPTQTLKTNNTDGAITFLFHSDASVEKGGFDVAMVCGVTPTNTAISDADIAALVQLKNNLNINDWILATNTFPGVTFNQQNPRRVTTINLTNEGLQGEIPDEFAFDPASPIINDDRMAYLSNLDLSNNGISGEIPTTFGKLKLAHLNLSNNLFKGGIPAEFENLNNLVTLNLSSNLFDDTSDFDALEDLQYLSEVNLSNNLFDGTLPISLLKIENLTNLNISINGFNGTLPTELIGMQEIKVLNLSENNFTGTLSDGTVSLFKNQPYLEHLDLSKNQLTGTIPQVSQLLKFLNLSSNKLTGGITFLLEATGLIDLQVQKNQLSGTLPLGLHNLSFAVNINLSNNKFTGTIPNLTNFTFIRTLDLSFNKFNGKVPASLNQLIYLTSLLLNDNELVDLPILTGLADMQNFAVYNNKLTFEDLEHNITIPNFTAALYAPQANINDTIRINTTLGSRVKMATNTAGTANLYRWKKGNIPIKNSALPNDSLYVITSAFTDDAGFYSCDITSTKVVGLTLIRNPIILNVGNPQVNVSDSLALVALYRSAGGKNWENTWNLSLPVRTWYGVTLDVNRVVALRLNDNKLDGTITDSLRLLSRLEELNLRKNKLADKIPSGIGQITNLNRLDLSGNRLTSELPTTLGSLVKLTYLDLSENKLDGDIPTSFTNLTKLVNLFLNDNNFVAMPPLKTLTVLKKISVENNRLTFGDFELNQSLLTLSGLNFSYSPQAQVNATQTIQATFATSLTLTTQTSGSANKYQWTKSGTNIGSNIATSDYKINSLNYPDSGAYSCKITNSLIPNLTLTRRTLTLIINLPGLLKSDSLALVDLYNSTNGASWDKKWDLTQPMDTWFGVVLDKNIGRVIRVLLSNNKLKGSISTTIGNLTKLKELNIRANPDLNGTIPNSIGNLLELEDLNLRGNKLTGSIPAVLGNLINLKTLALDNNQLSGAIPKELGKLINLSVLFLNNNKFTGTLPTEINSLTLLQELYLNDNLLDKLPTLQGLGLLGTLDVKNNQLGFESLESLIRIASFQYSPQASKDTTRITIQAGQTLTLNTQAGGTQNTYSWRTNPMSPTVTTPILNIPNAQAQNSDFYICNVKNSLLPSLTITYIYFVKVIPKTPDITQPLPYCIGNSSVTLIAQDKDQAQFTQWTWYNKENKEEITKDSKNFTFVPKQNVDTVYAKTVFRNVESSARAMIIVYVRPIFQNNNGVFTVLDNNNSKNKYQWYYFESIIAGATNKTFTPEANKYGDYKVSVITEEGCAASDTTYRYKNVLTATEDEMLKNSLKIYPNPASENLELVLDNDYFGATKITISDVLGRVLWEQKVDKTSIIAEQKINVADWASGTYCLRLQTDKGFAIKRFVKQ